MYRTDDELIYIPGRWKYADGSVAFRITRIYVSSKESTENGERIPTKSQRETHDKAGRRNWNIPSQFKLSFMSC
jgi:hypothetical protein